MTAPNPTITPEAFRGAGMDRKIPPSAWRRYARPAGAAAALVVVAFVAALALMPGSARTMKIESGTVTVGDVTRGAFEDFVPIRGRVTPLNTVYLDALEGGRQLFASGNTAKSDLENIEDEFYYQKRKFDLLTETLRTTERLQETQLKQIKETAERLVENLDLARRNLDGLMARAPG